MKKTMELKCQFTPEELEAKAAQMAKTVAAYGEMEAEKSETAKRYTERLTAIWESIQELARLVRDKGEVRLVECEVQLHVPDQGVKRTIRLDTGEIERDEPMTPEECQEQLFPADRRAADEAPAAPARRRRAKAEAADEEAVQ